MGYAVATMTPGARIGVDVGRTFTDLVASDPSGAMCSCKVPSTPASPAAVLDGIRAPAPRRDRGRRSLTAPRWSPMPSWSGAPVGLVTTRGFRDVLEIARRNRSHLYRLDLPARPDPPVPRHLSLETTERVGPDGTVRTPLALEEVGAIVATLTSAGVESVAVCLLHAHANAAREHALRLTLEPHFPYLSVSSEITCSSVYYAIKALAAPDAPPNEGCYRPLSVIAPRGTVLNCDPDRPAVGRNHETSQRVVEGKTLAGGDLVLIETCGGGGYGSPADRSPALAAGDRLEGYLV